MFLSFMDHWSEDYLLRSFLLHDRAVHWMKISVTKAKARLIQVIPDKLFCYCDQHRNF